MRLLAANRSGSRMEIAPPVLGTSKNPIIGRIAASIVQCAPRNTEVLLRFAPCAASRLTGF